MCGEIDEQVLVGQEMLDRLRAMAPRTHPPRAASPEEGPMDLSESGGRAAYMERIFQSGLVVALAEIERAEEDETIDALAAQAIALARLAGFLAGQLPPEADLFRALIDAVSAGHAEPRDRIESLRRAQDHHHDHSHSHDHDHGHSHDHH